MHPKWSRKTCLFRKMPLSASKMNRMSVFWREARAGITPTLQAASLPRETHRPQMRWVTNRKTTPLMTATSQRCAQECCQDNTTRVEQQTGRFAWTVPEERYLQSIYHRVRLRRGRAMSTAAGWLVCRAVTPLRPSGHPNGILRKKLNTL